MRRGKGVYLGVKPGQFTILVLVNKGVTGREGGGQKFNLQLWDAIGQENGPYPSKKYFNLSRKNGVWQIFFYIVFLNWFSVKTD